MLSMKKLFFTSFLSLVASSCLLAQSAGLSNPTDTAPSGAVEHLEATYNVVSAKGAPRATITWVADLKNDQAPFLYQVTVTLKNETEKIFNSWNLTPLFIGTIPTHRQEKMINDPNNPGQQIKVVENVLDVSSKAQVRACLFSPEGPAPGYAIFGGTLEENTMNLPAHGSITFTYIYQLPAAQETVVPPFKMILSRALSYVAVPTLAQPVSSEEDSFTTL